MDIRFLSHLKASSFLVTSFNAFGLCQSSYSNRAPFDSQPIHDSQLTQTSQAFSWVLLNSDHDSQIAKVTVINSKTEMKERCETALFSPLFY